jgi:hypothetical protein
VCAVKTEIDPHGRLFTTAVTFEVKQKFYFTTYKQGQDTHKYPYKLTTQVFKSDFPPFAISGAQWCGSSAFNAFNV